MQVSVERLRQVLTYNPVNGDLIWKHRGNPQWDARYAGTRAGALRRDLYVTVSVDNVNLAAHRIAWALQHGRWPEHFVDHIDGLPCENSGDDIRAATPSQNSANSRVRRTNILGVKGVHYDAARKRYCAQLMVNGKKRNLGRFKTLAPAKRAYAEGAKEAFGAFAKPSYRDIPRHRGDQNGDQSSLNVQD